MSWNPKMCLHLSLVSKRRRKLSDSKSRTNRLTPEGVLLRRFEPHAVVLQGLGRVGPKTTELSQKTIWFLSLRHLKRQKGLVAASCNMMGSSRVSASKDSSSIELRTECTEHHVRNATTLTLCRDRNDWAVSTMLCFARTTSI